MFLKHLARFIAILRGEGRAWPQHRWGRGRQNYFEQEEILFRRFRASQLDTNGDVIPASLSISKPLSCLRSAYARPDHALHADCCGGADRREQAVYGIPLISLPSQDTGDGTYVIRPEHDPEESCYAHSNLRCFLSSNEALEPRVPGRLIRKQLVAKIALDFRAVIPPSISG